MHTYHRAPPSDTTQNPHMEPGELVDTTVEASGVHLQRMCKRLFHLRRWVTHLMGKIRKLDDDNSALRELTHRQAKHIERLQEGILVRLPLPCHPPLGTDQSNPGRSRPHKGTDMPPVQGNTSGSPHVG